jgi:clan AA aspartic protease
LVGQFRIDLTLLARHDGPSRTIEALVDTGAAYTVVPRPVLESLGCRPVRTQRVVLADGRSKEWSVTQIDVECAGRRTTTPILMGPADGPVLLGTTTLEELGLRIDPLNRCVIPIEFLSVDEVESWKETLAITSNRDFMEEIRKGLELLRKRKARLYTLEELFGGTS